MKKSLQRGKLSLNLQMFAENNLQDSKSFGTDVLSTKLLDAKSIDFTHRFGENFKKFLEALGVTRSLPVQEGFTIKMYTGWDVTLADGDVAEGELIPLSKVEPKEGSTKEVKLKKYRKATTIEAIQRYGANNAVDVTDGELVKELQKGIRGDLFTLIKTAGTTKTNLKEGTLQGALATAWGTLEVLFEDDGVQTIAFVNPMDVAKEIANKELTLETQFGLRYYTTVTGTVVFTSSQIEQGKIYATAPENLVVAYIPSSSEGYRAFNMTTDQFGFIGMTHDKHINNLTVETVLATGILMFPERLDGVVEVSIAEEAEEVPEG